MIIRRSKQEIDRIADASKIVGEVIQHLKDIVEPGMTTQYIANVAEKMIIKRGGVPAFLGYRGFPGSICTSINYEVVHGIPKVQRLKEGEILKIDIGVRLKDYCSDAASTVKIGKVSHEAERLMAVTEESLYKGIEKAVENNRLYDIGTNGEIVIGNKDWLVCCASSAGPAFEGGGIGCGIRAMDGAIQKIEITSNCEMRHSMIGNVRPIEPAFEGGGIGCGIRAMDGAIQKIEMDQLDYEVKYSTIGNVRPIGICGSGLIDTLTELLKAGIIDRAGNIREDVPTERIRRAGDGLEFVLVKKEESGTGEDMVITQADISNLIFSKGAIYTAASVLAKKMGFQLQDIKKLYIAGGFGNYLNIEKAIMIGLLPDIDRDKLQFIGNSSLAGARLCLLSQEAMKKAEEIGKKMTYIELSADSDYMHEYTASLFLPHTDIDRFPTAKRN